MHFAFISRGTVSASFSRRFGIGIGLFCLVLVSWVDQANARGDKYIETLIARMSVEEKLGQLAQFAGGRSKSLNSRLTPQELDRIRAGRVGSYLHVAGAKVLRDLQRVAVEESRHGIPLLFAMDVVHGYRTIFPVPLALAGSFDSDLVERMARISAVEASAAGLHWTFAPMIDVSRDARWGRVVESAGEDAYLNAVMAAAQVRGYQGSNLSSSDTVLATPKHFVAYGAAMGGRDYDSADISARSVFEIYLPPFRAAVDAGAGSIMSSFNDVGGVPATAHRPLIRETLKTGWGFDGLVLSDWNAIAELINHGVAADRTAAGRLALDAGIDMDMMSAIYADDGMTAAISKSPKLRVQLDDAVRRVLTVKKRLGLFENPYQYHDEDRERDVILSADHRREARRAAASSTVLLKNDEGLLPLSEDTKSIAVIGALAGDASSPLGSWRAQGRTEDVTTLLTALKDRLPRTNIVHVAGSGPRTQTEDGIPAAVEAAEAADVTILMIGEDFDLSGEARSRSSVDLPGSQRALAKAVLATGKPVIVLLTNGRPLAVPWLAEHASTILETWFLGVEAGHALCDVLFGDVAPGGKLPMSFPRRTGQIPIYYGHLNRGRPADEDLSKDTARYIDIPTTPLFPFGHGLSYTDFTYSDLSLSKKRIKSSQNIVIAVTVTNSGARAGDEVVQLYLRDPVATIARPVKELRGFKRLSLQPGESKRIAFTVSAAQMAFFDASGNWVIEPGRIDVMIGSSSADIRLRDTFDITTRGRARQSPASIITPVKLSD